MLTALWIDSATLGATEGIRHKRTSRERGVPGCHVPYSPPPRDERDLRSLVVPQVGVVTATEDLLEPVQLLDADGSIDEGVRQFVRHLIACDYSSATCRSYVLSLLRWLRFLAAVDVPWDRAERREVRDFVLWMKGADNPQRRRRPERSLPGTINPVTGKRTLSEGYAPATINHALSAARMFYEYHLMTGQGAAGQPRSRPARSRPRSCTVSSQSDRTSSAVATRTLSTARSEPTFTSAAR